MGEVKGGASRNGLLADDAVGKNAKILYCFAEIKDNAICSRYVLRSENGDMGFCWVSVERKASGLKSSRSKATTELAANTCCLVLRKANNKIATLW